MKTKIFLINILEDILKIFKFIWALLVAIIGILNFREWRYYRDAYYIDQISKKIKVYGATIALNSIVIGLKWDSMGHWDNELWEEEKRTDPYYRQFLFHDFSFAISFDASDFKFMNPMSNRYTPFRFDGRFHIKLKKFFLNLINYFNFNRAWKKAGLIASEIRQHEHESDLYEDPMMQMSGCWGDFAEDFNRQHRRAEYEIDELTIKW